MCDTVLYADDGQQARAHSIVLAAASPVFRDALRVNGSDTTTPRSEPHMIQLPGCDIGTLELALHIIYTGSVEDEEGVGASADDLQRVFLLLQQLGVELDRIEGCSITYVERAGALPASGGVQNMKQEDTDESGETADDESRAGLKIETVGDEETRDGAEEMDAHVDGIIDDSNVGISAIIATEDGTIVSTEEHNAVYELVTKPGSSSEYYLVVRSDEGELGEEDAAEGEDSMMTEEGQSSDGDPENRKVHCPHCERSFPKVSYLQVHMRKHTGEKPFECDQCGRGFSQRANLQRHVNGHKGQKPYLCNLCGKTFIQKVQLTTHLAHSHTSDDGSTLAAGTKRFKCRVCHQVFAERGHLRQHAVRIHPESHREAIGAVSAADKTHVCDTCGRGYTTMGALRMHMRVHTGELMSCSMCDKAYVNRALLEQHLRTHTREKAFECKQCGKAFIYKNALTVHIRTHTGEKPYVCQVCHNSYSQFGHLQSHKKTHTGERPYSCSMCNKSYRQRVDLRMHNKRVHADLPIGAVQTPIDKMKMEEVIIDSTE